MEELEKKLDELFIKCLSFEKSEYQGQPHWDNFEDYDVTRGVEKFKDELLLYVERNIYGKHKITKK